jgi:hypothetical protein
VPATSAEQADQATTPILSPEERRWLHDKYERLSSEEAQLAGGRTSYYAAIGTVLVTGLLVAVVDLGGVRWALASAVTFLALLGILISSVWAVLLHRTNDALRLWRAAAFEIETRTPPLTGHLIVPVPLRSGAFVDVDVLRPYSSHRQRFSPANHISWIDRVDPEKLTEVLPMTFLVIWSTTLVLTWAWFFFLR